MIHKAFKAVRKAAMITLVIGAPMMIPGVAERQSPTSAPTAAVENARPVAGLLVPARTRLIIEYRRTALV